VLNLAADDEKALDEPEGVAGGSYVEETLEVTMWHEGCKVYCLAYVDPITKE
jgi:hypothetical protein